MLRAMLSVEEALANVLDAAPVIDAERVGLADSLGRVLATTLCAREDAPSFDASAMDGYALLAASLASPPVTLPLRGESRAGAIPEALAPGATMRIFTGAPLPLGADAVVMQENVALDGVGVTFREPVAVGNNVRHRASDLAAGAPLLDAGTPIGSGEIGLLASQGFAEVEVRRRPRVAILGTGDELRALGEVPRPGSIVDSNSHAMAAAVREAGGDPVVLARVTDDRAAIAEAIGRGLSCDALITTGGVSVGDHDLVHVALEDAGVTQRFWKVKMKPGKPLAFGLGAKGTPVFGLPGNPVSAWVTFELFVRPALRRMQGDPRPLRRMVPVTLATPIRHKPGRAEFVRASLEEREGVFTASPLRTQSSGALVSMARVDCLVVVPAEREDPAAGDALQALLLR